MAPMISGSKLKDEGDELFDKDSFKQRKIYQLREHVEKISDLLEINLVKRLEKFITIKKQKVFMAQLLQRKRRTS